MGDSKELEVVEGEVVQLGALDAGGPDGIIVRATAIATPLAELIKDRNLFTRIRQKDYVRVEGWNTLGAMLGIVPRERYVNAMSDNGGYEAYVELIRTSDGAVIGGASAICARAEKRWGQADEYAVRSMAITRATGKAFRLGFSWIMALAGFEPTLAEEMEEAGELAPRYTGNQERPLDANDLKSAINARAAQKGNDRSASGKQSKMVASLISECFAGENDIEGSRHLALAWMFGKESTKELTVGQASAAIDWLLDPDNDDGVYDLHPAAYQEAHNARDAELERRGQTKMEMGDE